VDGYRAFSPSYSERAQTAGEELLDLPENFKKTAAGSPAEMVINSWPQ